MKELSITHFPYKIEVWNEKSHSWFLYNGYHDYESALRAYNFLIIENKFIYRIVKVLVILNRK